MNRLMIVDDQDAVRRSLRRDLRGRDLAIEDFASGADALVAHHERPFDAALLDLRMPGMDGVELARRLQESSPAIRVGFVTGDSSPLVTIAQDLGPVLSKPWDRTQLQELVDSLLPRSTPG